MENCTKFGQLILSKIIKIVATSCQISRLKCTKFDFGWGSAPDPAGGAYSVPPDPLAGLRVPTSKGREAREGEGKGGRGKEREGGGGGERGGRRGEGRGVLDLPLKYMVTLYIIHVQGIAVSPHQHFLATLGLTAVR